MRYAFLILVFLHFPGSSEAQMITAHRGASFDAPENTLSAFNLAWEQNADAIEGDFYLTRDNQIVCIHDKDTKRTAGEKRVVAESTREELRRLEYGSWKNNAFRGEPIPTFEQVLATVPAGKTFVIELKSDKRIVKPLADELARLKPKESSLLIIAFDSEVIAYCKELLPNVRAHWLTSFDSEPGEPASPSAEQIAQTVRNVHADGVGMQGKTEFITRAFVDRLISGGCHEFHVWTVDDPADAKYFQSLRAVGITTNRPAFIRDSLTN